MIVMVSLSATASPKPLPSSSSPSCSLANLTSSLHLITFTDDLDGLALNHFLAHYTSARVGVDLANVHVLIDSRALAGSSDGLQRLQLEVLRTTLRLPRGAMSLVPMHNASGRGGFDRLKLHATNTILSSLPLAAWAIVADVDEFFEYPCTIHRTIRKQNRARQPLPGHVFCARMTDRLAASGRIEAMRPAPPSLAAQYPISCTARQELGSSRRGHGNFGAGTRKVVLFRVRVHTSAPPRLMLSPHYVSHNISHRRPPMPRCDWIGDFAHYTLTLQQYERLNRKLNGSDAGWASNLHLARQYQNLRRWMRKRLPAAATAAGAYGAHGDEGAGRAPPHTIPPVDDFCRRHEVSAVLAYNPAPQMACCELWLLRWRGVLKPTWHVWSNGIAGVERAERMATKAKQLVLAAARRNRSEAKSLRKGGYYLDVPVVD